jgi:hypothetical protein
MAILFNINIDNDKENPIWVFDLSSMLTQLCLLNYVYQNAILLISL